MKHIKKIKGTDITAAFLYLIAISGVVWSISIIQALLKPDLHDPNWVMLIIFCTSTAGLIVSSYLTAKEDNSEY